MILVPLKKENYMCVYICTHTCIYYLHCVKKKHTYTAVLGTVLQYTLLIT